MKCDQCQTSIEAGEQREIHGRTLCEDCYMDVLSPTRTCDPWAVYHAKSVEEISTGVRISDLQSRILDLLEETGGLEPEVICRRLNIDPRRLEREVATLRHMEKVRGERVNERVIIRSW